MPTDRSLPAWRTRYGILAAALLFSAACQVYIVARSPVIAKDGMGFIQIAKDLAIDPAGAMRMHDQHPGYPALVLACERVNRWLTGQDEFQSFIAGTRLASGMCGLLTVVFLWLFARRLYDERIANVTVLLAAVWPLFRLNASDSLSDTPHLMFYLAGAWLACEGLRSRRVGWFAAAGVASGLAFWIRPEGLVIAAAAGVALLIDVCRLLLASGTRKRPGNANDLSGTPNQSAPQQSGTTGRLTPPARLGWAFPVFALIALVAATSAVVAPYVVVAGKITSKKLPFRQPPPSAHAVAVASVEPTPGILSEPGPGGTLPDEFRRPSKLIGVVALGLIELGRELAQGFYYLALIPLAVGSVAPGRQKPGQPMALLHVLLMNGHMALLMLLYLTAGYISHRHIIPLVALMLPTAAAGTVWLAEVASRCLSRMAHQPTLTRSVSEDEQPTCLANASGWYWALCHAFLGAGAQWGLALAGTPQRAVAIAIGIFYLGLVPKCLTPVQGAYLPVFKAAQWVKDQAKPGDSVLSTSGYVRFYTNLPGILVGSEAPNLPIALYFAPNKVWTFMVLEIDERTFDRQTLCGSHGAYDQVLELAAHPRKPWAKIIVFRARTSSPDNQSRLATLPERDAAVENQ